MLSAIPSDIKKHSAFLQIPFPYRGYQELPGHMPFQKRQLLTPARPATRFLYLDDVRDNPSKTSTYIAGKKSSTDKLFQKNQSLVPWIQKSKEPETERTGTQPLRNFKAKSKMASIKNHTLQQAVPEVCEAGALPECRMRQDERKARRHTPVPQPQTAVSWKVKWMETASAPSQLPM